VGIHIGEGVLHLAEVTQQFGDHGVALLHQVHQRVVFDILSSELSLVQESGVGVSQHGVAVPRYHSTRFQHGMHMVDNLLISRLIAHFLLHLGQEQKHLSL